MNKIFRCPYCKSDDGYYSETPIRGRYVQIFCNDGELVDGDYEISTWYKLKYKCSNCEKDITSHVNKFMGELNKKD